MRIVPLTLEQANEFIHQHHRHHAPVVSHRWSVGLANGSDELIGAAICGRPKARALPQYAMLEVNRLATDGTPNACSKLYGACARIAREMGYAEIETSILETEPGTSLKAAGWEFRRIVKGRDWNCPSRGGRRTDQPMCDKHVYGKVLNSAGVKEG
jgi:hypothetical protein